MEWTKSNFKITSIASISPDKGIGLSNKLINFNTEDMKLFKRLTTGKAVVMGRNTFQSLKKPLVDRLNIVLSNTLSMSDIEIPDRDRVLIIRDFDFEKDSIFNYVDTNKYNHIYVIGGSVIYDKFKDIVDEHVLSEFPIVKEADTFYPNINLDTYKLHMTTYYNNFKLKKYVKSSKK